MDEWTIVIMVLTSLGIVSGTSLFGYWLKLNTETSPGQLSNSTRYERQWINFEHRWSPRPTICTPAWTSLNTYSRAVPISMTKSPSLRPFSARGGQLRHAAILANEVDRRGGSG